MLVRGSNSGIASYADIHKPCPEKSYGTPGFLAAMAARRRLFGLIFERMVPGQLPNLDTNYGELRESNN
jgi:hypothetical protein